MIDGQRILVVCPARGGSKGIPHKNLKPFLGVPLVLGGVAVVAALVPARRASRINPVRALKSE